MTEIKLVTLTFNNHELSNRATVTHNYKTLIRFNLILVSDMIASDLEQSPAIVAIILKPVNAVVAQLF